MFASQPEEEGFWKAIAEAPQDETTRLIFADWLEERNDPRGPLLRERIFWPHLSADCRDPVQVVLGVLDACPTSHSERLEQAAAMVGAPLLSGLLQRCRAARSSCDTGAAELLAALPSDCLTPILSDLIELLPRHAAALARVLPHLGPAVVAAVPGLLDAERTRTLDRESFAQAIARIGPAAGSPAVIDRLVDLFCQEEHSQTRTAIAEALAVVALPCLEAVLGTILQRAPAHFSDLAWKWAPHKKPSLAPLQQALRSADDYVRWAAACVLARGSAGEALPHLLDALRRAPLPLLQPVVAGMLGSRQQTAEALPLLRELLGRPELPFVELVAHAVVAQSDDPAGEVAQRLSDPNPLIRQRILLGMGHGVTRDDRGLLALVGSLLDPDREVRRAAGTYCSQYIFLSGHEEAVVAPLRQALADADPVVRAGAANALRHLRRRAAPAQPDLLALLRRDPEAQVRRTAGRSLATLEYETQAIFAGLEAGLDDDDEEVRRICAWGLCHWESMTAERVRVVLRRLGQVDSGLASFLAFAVCRSQAALPEVTAFLHEQLRKKNKRSLQSAAAVALGRLKVDDAGVLADLFTFLDSGEEDGTEALCLLGPAALPGLIDRLRQGTAPMREQLLRKAADLRERNPHLEELAPGVLPCLRHETDEVRKAALRVLRGCQRRSAEAACLVEAMIWKERNRETRCDAIKVLARISPDPQAVAAIFAEVQKDRDAEVRAAVPDALAYLGLSPESERELLHAALRDVATRVQTAAAWRARSLGPAAAPLLEDLLRVLNSEDWWTRTCVTQALEAMGAAGAPALEALRREARREAVEGRKISYRHPGFSVWPGVRRGQDSELLLHQVNLGR